jgi:aarF domain-containing kinase
MMLRWRPLRLAIFAVVVVRIYLNYKIPQIGRRLGVYHDTPEKVSNRHRRSALLLYRLAVGLQGLMIKPCQFLSSRADLVPDEYIEVLSRLQDKVPPRPYRVIARQVRHELGAPPAARLGIAGAGAPRPHARRARGGGQGSVSGH